MRIPALVILLTSAVFMQAAVVQGAATKSSSRTPSDEATASSSTSDTSSSSMSPSSSWSGLSVSPTNTRILSPSTSRSASLSVDTSASGSVSSSSSLSPSPSASLSDPTHTFTESDMPSLSSTVDLTRATDVVTPSRWSASPSESQTVSGTPSRSLSSSGDATKSLDSWTESASHLTLSAQASMSRSPSSTPSLSLSATPTPSSTLSEELSSASVTASHTPTSTSSRTSTLSASLTPAARSSSATDSPTATVSKGSESPTASPTASQTPSSTTSPTPSESPTAQRSSSVSTSRTQEVSMSLTLRYTYSESAQMSQTLSDSLSPLRTGSGSIATPTSTNSSSPTQQVSRTLDSPSPSRTLSSNVTVSPSPSQPPSLTESHSNSVTPSKLTVSARLSISSSPSTTTTAGTVSQARSVTVSASTTPTPTTSATSARSASVSMSPTDTDSPSLTLSADPTDSLRSASPTATASPSFPKSPTVSDTASPTGSASVSEEQTASRSRSLVTVSVDATSSASEMFSGSVSLSESWEVTMTRSPTKSVSPVTKWLTGTETITDTITQTKSFTLKRDSPTHVLTRTASMTTSLTVTLSLLPLETDSLSPTSTSTASSTHIQTRTYPNVTETHTRRRRGASWTATSETASHLPLVTSTPTATPTRSGSGLQSASRTNSLSAMGKTLSLSNSVHSSVSSLRGLTASHTVWTETLRRDLAGLRRAGTGTLSATVSGTTTVSLQSKTYVISLSISKSVSRSRHPRDVAGPVSAAAAIGARRSGGAAFLDGSVSCAGLAVLVLLPCAAWYLFVALLRGCVYERSNTSLWVWGLWRLARFPRAAPQPDGMVSAKHRQLECDSTTHTIANENEKESRGAGTVRSRGFAFVKEICHFAAVIAPDHVYLGALVPCCPDCAPLHALELVQHVCTLMCLIALLLLWAQPVATNEVFRSSEHALSLGMQIVVAGLASLVSGVLRCSGDAAAARILGALHTHRVWLLSLSKLQSEWRTRTVERTRDDKDVERAMVTVVEMLDGIEFDDEDIAAVPAPLRSMRFTQDPNAVIDDDSPKQVMVSSAEEGVDIDVTGIDWDDIPLDLMPGDFMTITGSAEHDTDSGSVASGIMTAPPRTNSIGSMKSGGKRLASYGSVRKRATSGGAMRKKEDSWFAAEQGGGEPVALLFDFIDEAVSVEDEDEHVKSKSAAVAVADADSSEAGDTSGEVDPRFLSHGKLRQRAAIERVLSQRTKFSTPTTSTSSSISSILSEADPTLGKPAHAREAHYRSEIQYRHERLGLEVPWWSQEEAVRRVQIIIRLLICAVFAGVAYAALHHVESRAGAATCSRTLEWELLVAIVALDIPLTQLLYSTAMTYLWHAM